MSLGKPGAVECSLKHKSLSIRWTALYVERLGPSCLLQEYTNYSMLIFLNIKIYDLELTYKVDNVTTSTSEKSNSKVNSFR